MTHEDDDAPDDRGFRAPVQGPAQFAVRAKTPPGDVWFTIGQAWAFEVNGETQYSVRLSMTPTNWNGEMLLVPIPKSADGSPSSK